VAVEFHPEETLIKCDRKRKPQGTTGVHGVNRDLVRVPNIAKGVTLGWAHPTNTKGRAVVPGASY